MKRILTFLAFLPVLLFGAANDIRVQQMNTGGTAFVDRIFAPVSGTSFTTNAGFKTALGLGLLDSPTFTRVYAGAGTAALPSFAFSGDTDTGFWNKAANSIGVAMNGVDSGYFSNVSSGIALSATSNGAYLALKGAGGVDIIAAGTNQPVTIAPSGTAAIVPGTDITPTLGTTALRFKQGIFGPTGLSIGLGSAPATITTSSDLANANLVLAPNGTGWTQIVGTQLLKFGATALASIGVSADTTGATLTLTSPSAGSMALRAGGAQSLVLNGDQSAGFSGVVYPGTTGLAFGLTGNRWGASYFSGPLYIGAASGTSPTISVTGVNPTETLVFTPAGAGANTMSFSSTGVLTLLGSTIAFGSGNTLITQSGNTRFSVAVNGDVTKGFLYESAGQTFLLGGVPLVLSSALNATGDVGVARDAANNIGITNGSSITYWKMGAAGIIAGAGTTTSAITGGAGNMTILAGTGASRTLTFQTTTSGSTATTALTLGADQSVAINSTSPIKGVRTNTATLNFASILAAASEDLTITVTGAAVGDTVSIGLPATVLAGAIFNGWVSATDTVTIRCNNAGSIAVDPASATYRATVITF